MSPVWRVRLFIIFLALIAGGMGYLYFTQRITPEERAAQRQAQLPVPPESTPVPDTTLVNIAQVLAVPYEVDAEPNASQAAILDFIADYKPSVVTIFGSQISTESASQAISEILNQAVPEEQPLIAVDHEGGTVQRLNGEGFTRLPTWKRVCDQTADVRQASLATSAAELRSVGVSIVFAPVVDVADSNFVLRDRVCSGDPDLVSSAAVDYIEAFQDQSILPVLKHYPGLGSATVDTHNQIGSVTVTEKDTRPFKVILDRYPSLGVMSAHIQVENQGLSVPCSLSSSCIGQIFELYPEVVVFSDALEMEAASYNPQNANNPKPLDTVAVEALAAGTTVLVFGQDVTAEQLESVLSRIKLEYTSSSEFRNKVNLSVAKIELLKDHYKSQTALEN
ncbi:MAG: hypothetical protein QG639_841 [Patescibacteria group bacterium]|nr:hypothetical protein [Patescibacteria group bacterium]